jgi:catechol 2,3-dioxygenase-like lactoylglutathione lyase family enzyme
MKTRSVDASQAFYDRYLGLIRSQAGPPHAVVFETKRSRSHCGTSFPAPISHPLLSPASVPRSLHATDVHAIHDALVADGHTIVSAPIDGPFGRTFTLADPDGYQVILHDRA